MLKIKNMNLKKFIRQGDTQPREYQLDTGNLNLNLANKRATIRLMTDDYKGIAYETTATVSSGNKITFSIDDIIPACEYHLEITVDNYVFPSRALDEQFKVDPSSHGQEVSIIQIIGKDEIVRDVKEQVKIELEPFLGGVEQVELTNYATKVYVDTAVSDIQAPDLSNYVLSSRVLTDVPANAKFTDTTYTAGTGINISSNVISATGGGSGGYDDTSVVNHMNDLNNPHGVTKAQVGLGNVDNTSDANKPVSTATQSALNNKADKSQVLTNVPANAKFTDTVYTHPSTHPATMITETSTKRFVTDAEKNSWNSKQDALGFTPENISNKGQPNGYASLGADGKVPASQLDITGGNIDLGPVMDELENTEKVLNASTYVVGDGTANDTQGLKNAATDARAQNKTLHIPQNLKVKITSTVDLKFINLDIQGSIIVDMTNGIGVKVGGSSYHSYPIHININSIKNRTPATSRSDTKFSLQVEGLMNGKVTIMDSDSVRLYADGDTWYSTSNSNTIEGDISSIAYSSFTLGKIDYFYIFSNKSASTIGWINENIFFNGRFVDMEFDGNYQHEQNIFYKPCFEHGTLRFKTGHANIFRDTRTESANIEFEYGTSQNIVFDSFYGNATRIIKPLLVNHDKGSENEVLSNIESVYTKEPIFDLIPDVTFKNFDDSRYIFPGIFTTRIEVDESRDFFRIFNYARIFNQVIETDVMKRISIDYQSFEDINTDGIMIEIQCFDENMNLLEPTDRLDGTTWDAKSSGLTWMNYDKKYDFQNNVGSKDLLFSERTKYVHLIIMGGYVEGNPGFQCQRFSIHGIVKPFESDSVRKIHERMLTKNIRKKGKTSERPIPNYVGLIYHDEDLGYPIYCTRRTTFDGNGVVYQSAQWEPLSLGGGGV